jgi:tetratricopeptide (TPR) repeat protein
MKLALVAVALLSACRGDARSDSSPPSHRGSAAKSLVPYLPPSDDGNGVLRGLDQRIAVHRREPPVLLGLLLERASFLGRVEDYQQALAISDELIAKAPDDPETVAARVSVLSRVHRFADARAALDKLKPRVEAQDLETSLDEATGALERSAPAREARAKAWPNPTHLVQYAISLALLGKLDDALATMKRAAAAIHDNATELIAWLVFQWGRIYEQKGEPAAARELFAVAHQRMPRYLEATVHLARAMIATGDRAGAAALADEALRVDQHPELYALVGELSRPALVDTARAEWERYVAALPEAFADHAARFYLGVGKDPKRALELARRNLANRDTREARALFVEAALAAKDARAACDAADKLVVPEALRAQRFVAWRAFAACGRDADAQRLARELGIVDR